MLFNSFEFLLFFPIVTIIYFLLPHKFRWLHLLVASCIFYMYFVPIYILILIFTIIVDYIAGILIDNAEGNKRRLFLIMSIVANVGVLAVFKYYNFFIGNLNLFLLKGHSGLSLPLLKILLPIGLSFHTFQAMSYTIEVFRGNQKAERHFGIYALYVMFYPQLVAGPIERPQNLLHQFHEPKKIQYENVAVGMRKILWGIFKKVVIADRLGLTVDSIFGAPKPCTGTLLAMGIFFFAFQIYCDFSGYSDIALGTAKVMGFDLMVNFDLPFSSKNISEFWRRWHRSLSTWLGDYVFKPIAIYYRSAGIWAVVLASMITFLISGLWHGAAWRFVVWGGLHGIALSYETLTQGFREKIFQKIPGFIGNAIAKLSTFLFLCFTWIFFRANNIQDAFFIIQKIILNFPAEILNALHNRKIAALGLPSLFNIVLPGFGLIILLRVIQLIQKRFDLQNNFSRLNPVFRWSVYSVSYTHLTLPTNREV